MRLDLPPMRYIISGILPQGMTILLAAYFGLRRSEVLELKWSAVDFENKTVSDHFEVLLKTNGLRIIRYHDLWHPYVKPMTKKFYLF